MFRPLGWYGKAIRSLSSLKQGSCLVRAGIKWWCITSSKGWNKEFTDSIIQVTYVRNST